MGVLGQSSRILLSPTRTADGIQARCAARGPAQEARKGLCQGKQKMMRPGRDPFLCVAGTQTKLAQKGGRNGEKVRDGIHHELMVEFLRAFHVIAIEGTGSPPFHVVPRRLHVTVGSRFHRNLANPFCYSVDGCSVPQRLETRAPSPNRLGQE